MNCKAYNYQITKYQINKITSQQNRQQKIKQRKINWFWNVEFIFEFCLLSFFVSFFRILFFRLSLSHWFFSWNLIIHEEKEQTTLKYVGNYMIGLGCLPQSKDNIILRVIFSIFLLWLAHQMSLPLFYKLPRIYCNLYTLNLKWLTIFLLFSLFCKLFCEA